MEALERELARDLGMVGDQRRVGDVGDDELVVEALGIGEAQRVALARGLDAGGAEPLGPEVERGVGGDPPDDPVDHAVAGAPASGAAELEEGDVGAGAALLVGIEEVVDARLVLVDGLLDHPQAERAGVEVDVALRVAGDRGDVVDSLELHVVSCARPK